MMVPTWNDSSFPPDALVIKIALAPKKAVT